MESFSKTECRFWFYEGLWLPRATIGGHVSWLETPYTIGQNDAKESVRGEHSARSAIPTNSHAIMPARVKNAFFIAFLTLLRAMIAGEKAVPDEAV